MPKVNHKKKVSINNLVHATNFTTERNISSEKKNPENSSPESLPFYKRKWNLILFLSVGIIIIACSIFVIIYFLKRKDEPHQPQEPYIPGINITEAKKVFSKMFNIKTTEKTLTRLFEKSFQIYESSQNGHNSSNIIFNKALYDIFTINSTSPSDIEKNFFSSKYTTVITVNSRCSKFIEDPSNVDCDLKKNLDLNLKAESLNNLRRNEEDINDLINKAILPICLVEHTDTNLVISLTCPQTLSNNYKKDIFRAFSNIKPSSSKGFEFDKEYVNTILEEKEDKIYINSFDNVCLEPNIDPSKNMICNLTKNIITDKEGNLISSKISNVTTTIKDEKDIIYNNFTYEFENIHKENSVDFNEEVYKENLNLILSYTGSIMEKEVYIENFTNFVVNIMTKEKQGNETYMNSSDLRDLNEEIEEDKIPGIHEENIYNKTIYNIFIEYNLNTDIGFGEGQSAKVISSHNVNKDDYKEFSNYRIQTNFYETFNNFISISKSAGNILNKLNEDLNQPLLDFSDIISHNIETINSLIVNKDLSEIFDSTLIIKDLDSLPYTFITATDNLFNSIKQLQSDLLYTIDSSKKKLKNDVSTFLKDSHNLLFKLFNNLEELTELLSSNSNKLVEIQSYYLNNTDTSYYEHIQKAKDILDNYYKKEKNLIEPSVKDLLDKFYTNTMSNLEKYQTQLDDISERLDNGEIIISLATTEDYQKSINNIYNSKIIVNEIIETIKNKFLESINLQSNGYFISQNEIETNKQSLEPISEKSIKMAYSIDKNELIDKTFDEVMISFRDKFIELLNYNGNSIKQKFSLEENVLGSTLFDSIYLNEIDENLKTEKINILTNIKKENDNYLKYVNDIMNNFEGKSGLNMNKIISELFNMMNDLYFDNLNEAYNTSLYFTFKNINDIINYNIKLGDEFFKQVEEKKSVHITKRFKNQYKYFNDSIQEIKNFIDKQLKNNFANKYKNIINKIRASLQSIKSNKILEKYHKQLPLAKKHLEYITELFETFNRHISDDTYNNKFLPKIINFINTTNNILIKKEKEYENIYKDMEQKKYNDIKFDYDEKRVVKGERYCCDHFLWWCTEHCRKKDKIYYDGYNVKATKNYEKLKKINFDEYTKTLDNKFNELYPKLSKDAITYNSFLNDLDNEIKSKKENLYKSGENYLNNIEQIFKSILEEKLGNNLLLSSYNYFKNKISNILPNELDNIKSQWENSFNELYNNIDSNKEKFKSSIYEFFLIGNFYHQAYSQNIAYDYSELIVDKLKNEFNYTNKYYYNIITSKLNDTYSYILNNLPMNEKPFDDILNIRINEIKKSQKNIFKNFQNSKNEILNKNKQEVFLQVNSNNFFSINDIIKDHIKDFSSIILDKLNNLGMISYQIQKDNTEELTVAKFYLENSINGKHIKKNYEVVNKANFVDLQTDEYQKLIDEILKIDKDELIKNILTFLNKLNEINKNNFNLEYEKYNKILQNKLHEEFFTKDKLIEKINSLYTKGLYNPNKSSKEKIDNIIQNILSKIITHLTKEETKLSNVLTSYSKDFSYIEERLNNYKTSIYKKIYSSITYVVNDFHEEILEIFYKNYIEKGLNEYEKNIDDTTFGTVNFLNMSINLDEIIDKEFKLYITEYRNLTLNQIEYLFKKNIQILDELFNFSIIKETINNAIDNEYNKKLLPILKKYCKNNPGDEGISNYDLSSEILSDINGFIDQQISNIKIIMKEMKGKEYQINNFIPADFSSGKGNIYDIISDMFKNFSMSYTAQEKKEFNKVVGESVSKDFNNLISNFIPSFGVDFFDRILNYNQNLKIKSLYYDLKTSITETILYYIGLAANVGNNFYLPLDIKLKLYDLNNLDKIVIEKNNFIMDNLKNILDTYFEETKNYMINKYLNEMNTNEEFDLKFNDELIVIIKGIINGNIHNYENEYINKMKIYIREKFIKEYTNILNDATEDMKVFIEMLKIQLKAQLDNLFTLDSEAVLNEIEIKLNNTKIAVEEYNEHFLSFKISEEVIIFLDNFGDNFLISKYNSIKELLDKRTTELIINNMEKLSNEYRNAYSISYFQEEVNKINQNFSSYYNKFNNILKTYGTIEDVYKNNLEKEMANNTRLRLLDEEINNEINNGYKFADIKLDSLINEIKNCSLFVKDYIQNLDLFVIFENNINNYINKKNNQYTYSSYNLEKNKNKNQYYDLMVERLEELNQLSSEYYSQISVIYNLMKEQIINNINEINELINLCKKVTFDTISNKYIEIKNNFDTIIDSQNTEKKKIDIQSYKLQELDNSFTVDTSVGNYIINNKYILDLTFEGEEKTPKLVGKIESYIIPKKFQIDFYSSVGQNGKIGRKIDLNFKNISSYTNIIFDAGLNQVNIITNFNFDEFTVKTQYYETKETEQTINLGSLYIIPTRPMIVNIDTPEDERFCEIPSKNITLFENYYY